MPDSDDALTYAKHLQLGRLLSCQQRQSELRGRPAHDEMLFIVVHQAYELWFKQILFELDRIHDIFSGSKVDDHGLGEAVHLIGRVVEIQKLLLQQFDVLETMTPLDFLDFRDLLFPASGFQSLQFRLFETKLGLRRDERLKFDERPFDARLSDADREALAKAETRPSLSDLVEAWLERTPFVSVTGYDFREVYRQAVTEMLEGEAQVVRGNRALGAAEQQAELDSLQAALARFESIFDESRHKQLRESGVWQFSWQALQAALFINLYRDEPALQLPFRLLSRLMDVDVAMTSWRYRHALLVQRMIGRKVGTGGSSGHEYLRQTAERHRVFGDLFALSTFFIPRSRLPELPEDIRRAMDYRYSGTAL
jgi:tryptophan 2,3-dioxygenase